MNIKLKPWTVPNFVTAEMPTGSRQDGLSFGPQWHLKDVDVATLDEMCKNFRAEVFRKAEKNDPDMSPL